MAYDWSQYGDRLTIDHIDERAKENQANDDPTPRAFARSGWRGWSVAHLNLSRMAWMPGMPLMRC